MADKSALKVRGSTPAQILFTCQVWSVVWHYNLELNLNTEHDTILIHV